MHIRFILKNWMMERAATALVILIPLGIGICAFDMAWDGGIPVQIVAAATNSCRRDPGVWFFGGVGIIALLAALFCLLVGSAHNSDEFVTAFCGRRKPLAFIYSLGFTLIWMASAFVVAKAVHPYLP